jgi:hypothetical protein
VPSCRTCNGKFGQLEKELFIRLALCVDPTKAEASGISKSALRALGIGVSGISAEERAHRTAHLKKVFENAGLTKNLGGMASFPGLGPHAGFPPGEQIFIKMRPELLHSVSGKVLRGCEYKLNNQAYIEDPKHLRIYFAHDERIRDVTAVIEGLGVTTLGPGFEVRRGESPPQEEFRIVLYRIIIWGTLKIYAAISSDERLAELLGTRSSERT